MQLNVSTLLREFPKARQAAMRGERVQIKCREGNLILMAENPPSGQILGRMKGRLQEAPGSDLTAPTAPDREWNP